MPVWANVTQYAGLDLHSPFQVQGSPVQSNKGHKRISPLLNDQLQQLTHSIATISGTPYREIEEEEVCKK